MSVHLTFSGFIAALAQYPEAVAAGLARGIELAANEGEKWLRARVPVRTGFTQSRVFGFAYVGDLTVAISVVYPAFLWWAKVQRRHPQVNSAAIQRWLSTRGYAIIEREVDRAIGEARR